MISLILPYWDRQDAADKAFKTLEKYRDLDLEVVVVDDGNKVPFRIPETPLKTRVVRLPLKTEPTPQSKAWNAGVRESKGDVIVLSCVEILHHNSVLDEMHESLKSLGKDGYVLAAAWCPEEQRFHCSNDGIGETPKGTGPSYCGMMYKSHFEKVGGFDESYHEGAGYEDKDFIQKLLSVGTKFLIRDDLVVIHPKSGATIAWKAEGFARNRKLFESKWKTPITFVCLKAGTAYGPESVNILRDMVMRNLSEGFPGRFVCITDDPTGLDDGIEIIPLPSDLETWWGKLYMFKRGLFLDGTRCLFMDLDTLILSNIDAIAGYQGQFATLRDFYYPDRLGPAVIAWEAGSFASSIWEEWVSIECPRHPMGDLWWLNNLDQGRFAKTIDKLQDLFPNKFVSYKADCKPYPPKGASVVCFHGQPKPDNCPAEWVKSVWKVGGTGMAELEVIANTTNEIVRKNVLSACKRNIPWVEMKEPHKGIAVIVAGGPSLTKTIEQVKYLDANDCTVFAVNNSARYLQAHDILVSAQVIIDARPSNADFVVKCKQHYFASQCDPSVFDRAENVTLMHMNTEGIADILPKDREANLISSGTTVGMAAMCLAYVLGYRIIHLYGFDSSYEDSHHAYEQKGNDQDAAVEAEVYGRKFKCAPWMIQQVNDFQILAGQLADDGVTLVIAGDGLLPFVAQCMSNPQQEIANDRTSSCTPPVC